MRKLLCIGLAVAALGLAPSHEASAAALGFQGTLGVLIANLPPINVSGNGSAVVGGSGASLQTLGLAAMVFATAVSIPVTDPLAFPLAGVVAQAKNGAGSFGGSLLAGKMPLLGNARICLFEGCDGSPLANLVVPFTENGTRGVGLGGGPIVALGRVNVTVQGAPWTVGKVSAASAEVEGFVHGPASAGAETAAAASGVVQLVTPITIRTSIGSSPILPAFGILTLHFVPEPGTLLLLCGGVAGLGILGRSRSRS